MNQLNHHTPGQDTLFSDHAPAGAPPRIPHSPTIPALGELDWADLYGQLNDEGVAVTPPLLSREQCQEIIDTFEEPGLFRSTVVMQRYQFGRGTYKYYADPAAVPLVQTLRERAAG
ncbi:proline hydroxylase, partial [Streptomyces sp. NPDC051453]